MPANLGGLILPILLLVVFYFLLIRPQKKREKKIREMRASIKVGDKVVTIGGIHGKVLKVKDDSVVVEVGPDKTKLTFTKWGIGNIESDEKVNLDK